MLYQMTTKILIEIILIQILVGKMNGDHFLNGSIKHITKNGLQIFID